MVASTSAVQLGHGQHCFHSNTNGPHLSSNHHTQIPSEGPVAIFWDIENCPVPNDVRPEDVSVNIRMALRVHPVIKGSITNFSAYGDFNAFPRRLREGCQRTGIKLVDVPNGRKDAADKAILVDMFLFALDNRPPCYIMLISGDVDFAHALHVLGQRGYTVILVIPSGGYVSSALSNAGRFVWDWPSIARGEGFVPSAMPLMAPHGSSNFAEHMTGYHITEFQEGNEEEAIVYSGISQRSYVNYMDFPVSSVSLSEYNSSYLPYYGSSFGFQRPPSALNESQLISVPSNDQKESNWCFQPRDLTCLKGELVKLLELSGGYLPLDRVFAEYQKHFSRPLFVQNYGACKIVNLLKKMSDVMFIEGKGQSRSVYLRNNKGGSAAGPLVAPKSNKNGKESQEENGDLSACRGSSEEFSDDARVVMEEHDNGKVRDSPVCETGDNELEGFKQELQEILVTFYHCKILLSSFEEIYRQRYKRPLNYQRFGVNQLEDLFNKVRDVAVLVEEPMSEKYLASVGF